MRQIQVESQNAPEPVPFIGSLLKWWLVWSRPTVHRSFYAAPDQAMPQVVCAECGAGIESEWIEESAVRRCSSCGAALSATDVAGLADSLPDQRDAGFDTATSPDLSRRLPDLPEGSSIRIAESSADRLVLFLPGGGKHTAGIGVFAVVWNGFMLVFTVVVLAAVLNIGAQPKQKPTVVSFLVFALFWLPGLGLGWAWLRLKFLRTILLLERERIVLQEILFGRKKLRETTLSPDSRAELVESYQQNNVPVYRIEVTAPDGPARFGTSLSDPEKDWVVDRVNEFLGVKVPIESAQPDDAQRSGRLIFPEVCDECDSPLSGQAVDGVLTCTKCGARHEGWTDPAEEVALLDSTSPDDELANQTLRVVESSDDRLMLELKRHPASATGFVTFFVTIPLGIAAFCGVAFAIFRFFNAGAGVGGIVAVIALVPVLAAGLLVGIMILYAFRGRTEIELTRERLRCRWFAGPFRYGRTIQTAAITSLRVEDLSQSSRTRRRPNRAQPDGPGTYTCVVRSHGKMIPLTFLQTNACSREVEKLVRGKLTEWGLLPNND